MKRFVGFVAVCCLALATAACQPAEQLSPKDAEKNQTEQKKVFEKQYANRPGMPANR